MEKTNPPITSTNNVNPSSGDGKINTIKDSFSFKKDVVKKKFPKQYEFVIWFFSVAILIGIVLLVITFLPSGSSNGESSERAFKVSDLGRIFQKKSDNEEVSVPTPKPTPSPIFQGVETYTISQGNKTGPRITKAIIDPHDPILNADQNIKVMLGHTKKIDKVTIELSSDNKQKEAKMELTSGTNIDGIWEIDWKVDDTVLYNYQLTVKAKSGVEESKVDITIR